ncbi:MAG: DMT family transporter [Henriciella sp.]|nr:DMT family transporter [Henriciella sp.]
MFAAPLAILLAGLILFVHGGGLPALTSSFFVYGTLGGLAQIAATALLVHLFSHKNFAVATAFTKTETVQTALFGLILLGDQLTLILTAAIGISLIGVVLISVPRAETSLKGLFNQKTLIGIVSGGLFGLSAVAYRGASLSITSDDVLLRAVITLAFVTTLQAVLVLIYLRSREPGETQRLFQKWRPAGLVGLTGMLGSLAWFTAFTLQNAAYVRAVGQIEVVFMIAASVLIFKEKVSGRELLGVCLVSLGILGLVVPIS